MSNVNFTAPQSSNRTSAHGRAVQLTTEDVVGQLIEVLGKQLLAFIVDKDAKSIQRWANGEAKPRERDEKVLRNAYQVYALIEQVEGDHTVRAWFMGMNPQLDDESPAEALAEERFRDVAAAARAFVNGG